MADLKITELAALAGADLAAGDQLAIADSSASETKRITVTDLVGNATTLIADATIPGAKILFGSQQIAGTALANGAVDTTQLANDAVTGAKLADESTVDLVTTLPASGAFVGQIALDTGDNKIYCWNGSVWVSIKASGSANSFVGSSSGIVNIDITVSGDEVTIATSLDNTTAAAQFLAGPTGSAGAPTYRAIAGTDLPLASASQRGGIQVSGDGLRMDTGKIEIDNDVTATSGSYKIVDVNAKGLVVNYKDIEAVDLPVATDLTVGAVSPGSDLEVSAAGVLNHEEKVAGGGTFTKVTVNATGHVTAGTNLAEADIPSLNASKIGAGTLPTARIADDAITGAKVGDYAVSKFGEVQPTADHIGQFFFNPLTRGLFLWDGNVFQPVGISAGEIVLAGTYDASTNLLDSVTAEGSAAGFTNGQSLPSAGAGNNRYYVVVSQTGTGTAPAPTVTLEPPDILLSNGSSYVLIETSETITAQVASNVGFTPYGNLASTNVQGAIAELDDEKVALSGDTMTGDLTLGTGVNLVYEGATDNEFETTLTVTDPTADNTVTIPDESGTVVTTGSSGVVTSTMITDGTIVNADISSSAEIAVSKLADGSARQLLQTDAVGTGVEWASNIDIPGTLDVTGATVLDSNLNVDSGTFYVDAANNSVGVRTNAPGAHLHIGDAGATIRLGQTTGTAYTEIYRDSTSGFTVYDAAQADPSRAHVFQLGGTDALRINSDGNVGIGTSAPDGKLHVHVASAGTVAPWANADDFVLENDDGGVGMSILAPDASQANIIFGSPSDNIGSIVRWVHNDGELQIGTHKSDGFLTLKTAIGQERLRIDSSGNVGIGTISPEASLTISPGNSAVTSIGGRSINYGVNAIVSSGRTGYLVRAANNFTVDADNSGFQWIYPFDTGGDNDYKVFRSAAGATLVDKFWVNQAGGAHFASSVGIGTTSPDVTLEVSNSTPFLRLRDSDGTNKYTDISNANGSTYIDSRNGDNNGNTIFRGISAGATVSEYLRITSAGNVGIGTPSPSKHLDVRSDSQYQGIQLVNTSGQPVAQMLGFASDGDGGGLALWDGGAKKAQFLANGSSFFNGGNVGIGTGSPGAPLEISNAGPRIRLRDSDGTDTYGEVSASTGAIFISHRNGAANGQIIFQGQGGGAVDEYGRFDTSGRLLVGTSSTLGPAGFSPLLQVQDTNNSHISLTRNIDSVAKSHLIFSKTRGSAASPSIVQNNDALGGIIFCGHDGNGLGSIGASIEVNVDGTPGASDMPGRLVFLTTADGASSPTERMRIDSNGNIGTGGQDPGTTKLRIGGTVEGSASVAVVDSRATVGSDVTTGVRYFRGRAETEAASFNVGNITIFEAGQGTIGAGSTVANQYGFIALSDITGATNNYGFHSNLAASTGRWNFYANGTAYNYFKGETYFVSTDRAGISAGTATGKYINSNGVLESSWNTTNTAGHIHFRNPNGFVGSIQTSGSATSYNTSSDYRLKENVTPMTGAADRIKALKPCRFNFIADATTTVDGFLAHEAQEIVPESVTGTKDEMEDIGTLTEWDGTILETNTPEPDSLTWDETITDEDGNETVETRTRTWVKTGDRPVMQGIDQAKLVPLLTGALQEALAKIETLETRLTAAGL